MQIEPISISSSIKKQNNLITTGLFFVVASIIIFIYADLYGKTPDSLAPQILRGISIFSFLFFAGITACLLFRSKSEDALPLNRIDHISASNIGLIHWEDITKIKPKNISSGEFLMITVKNPDIYIKRASIWKKMLLKINGAIAKTPFNITLNDFNLPPESIIALVNEKYRKFKFDE